MKKDLIAALLVIKKKKNLDNLTLEKFIDYNYKQNPLLNQIL